MKGKSMVKRIQEWMSCIEEDNEWKNSLKEIAF